MSDLPAPAAQPPPPPDLPQPHPTLPDAPPDAPSPLQPHPNPQTDSQGPGREAAASLPPSTIPPEGPAFVLLKREDGGSFGRSNPFALRRHLVALCGGEVLTAKPIRSGSLLIRAKSPAQTRSLLACTKFLDYPVTAALADRLNTVTGSVRSDALTDLTNEELLQELADQGVCRVERLPSRQLGWGPNPTVRLTFQGASLPQAIRCGYLVVPVTPWVPAPPQCKNCWDKGRHTARNCRRRNPICGQCGGNHPSQGCQEPPHCVNCGGPHPAWTRSCPVNKDLREQHRQAQEEAKAAHLQRSRPGATWFPSNQPDDQWPPLAPLHPTPVLPTPSQAPNRPLPTGNLSTRPQGSSQALPRPSEAYPPLTPAPCCDQAPSEASPSLLSPSEADTSHQRDKGPTEVSPPRRTRAATLIFTSPSEASSDESYQTDSTLNETITPVLTHSTPESHPRGRSKAPSKPRSDKKRRTRSSCK